ncbi:hypothetical protein [Rhizobium leguminosarum]|uniref:hypothetical protein n=1 Tax=Rhizobium leguminosarum TaxID=384 RepID=UPI003D01B5B4
MTDTAGGANRAVTGIRNIYIQLAMSAVTGLLAVAAIIARIFVQQKILGDLNGKPPAEG